MTTNILKWQALPILVFTTNNHFMSASSHCSRLTSLVQDLSSKTTLTTHLTLHTVFQNAPYTLMTNTHHQALHCAILSYSIFVITNNHFMSASSHCSRLTSLVQGLSSKTTLTPHQTLHTVFHNALTHWWLQTSSIDKRSLFSSSQTTISCLHHHIAPDSLHLWKTSVAKPHWPHI